jgi:hypothetical protein
MSEAKPPKKTSNPATKAESKSDAAANAGTSGPTSGTIWTHKMKKSCQR